MRDKGRAVLSALGYEGECRPDCFYCTDPDYGHPKPHPGATVVDLSDPGVLLPMLRDWARENNFEFTIAETPSGHSRCELLEVKQDGLKIRKAAMFDADHPTAPVINAWYSALSALGKIREG